MRGATVKLIRSIPWWTIPSPTGKDGRGEVETLRQKKRYLLRGTTAKQRGRMRNEARFMGWFKDGKPKRASRALARLFDCSVKKFGLLRPEHLQVGLRATGHRRVVGAPPF